MEIYENYETENRFAPNHICYKADAVTCTKHKNCRWHVDRDENEIHVQQNPVTLPYLRGDRKEK